MSSQHDKMKENLYKEFKKKASRLVTIYTTKKKKSLVDNAKKELIELVKSFDTSNLTFQKGKTDIVGSPYIQRDTLFYGTNNYKFLATLELLEDKDKRDIYEKIILEQGKKIDPILYLFLDLYNHSYFNNLIRESDYVEKDNTKGDEYLKRRFVLLNIGKYICRKDSYASYYYSLIMGIYDKEIDDIVRTDLCIVNNNPLGDFSKRFKFSIKFGKYTKQLMLDYGSTYNIKTMLNQKMVLSNEEIQKILQKSENGKEVMWCKLYQKAFEEFELYYNDNKDKFNAYNSEPLTLNKIVHLMKATWHKKVPVSYPNIKCERKDNLTSDNMLDTLKGYNYPITEDHLIVLLKKGILIHNYQDYGIEITDKSKKVMDDMGIYLGKVYTDSRELNELIINKPFLKILKYLESHKDMHITNGSLKLLSKRKMPLIYKYIFENMEFDIDQSVLDDIIEFQSGKVGMEILYYLSTRFVKDKHKLG